MGRVVVKSGFEREPSRSKNSKASEMASDVLPLPVALANKVFLVLFFFASYILIRRWREKIRISIPLYTLSLVEILALLTLVASFSYLLGFFGIALVQNITPKTWDFENEREDNKKSPSPVAQQNPHIERSGKVNGSNGDEDIASAVVNGSVASHSLESTLGDCRKAVSVRRRAVELMTGNSLKGLPLEGFDYESIRGQCCELPVGYVQVPVGAVGPLLLDGVDYIVPMATTEGCLVASTSRGCKAIYQSGGATSILLKDGMTRAPVVSFGSIKRATELKLYVEEPSNFDILSVHFDRSVLLIPDLFVFPIDVINLPDTKGSSGACLLWIFFLIIVVFFRL